MNKVIKISSQVISSIIIIMVIIPLVLSLILQSSIVQTWIVGKATNYISEKIDSRISIGKIDIGRFYNIQISDFYVQSKIGRDTLLYVSDLTTRISGFEMISKDLAFSRVTIDGGELNIVAIDTTTTNIKDIIEKLRGGKAKKETATPFRMVVNNVQVNNFTFRYLKENHQDVKDGINYQDMEMQDVNISAKKLNIIGDSVILEVKHISLTEKSGVFINETSFKNISISPSEMLFVHGDAKIGDLTHFKVPYVKISYVDWDMYDYVNRVPMEIMISDCYVDFATIAKFTKEPRKWKSILSFDGTLNGTVANMSGVVNRISLGSTIIEDIKYKIKGIPNIPKTVFEFDVNNISSKLSDVTTILSDFSTKGDVVLPEILISDSQFNVCCQFKGTLTNFNGSFLLDRPDGDDGSLYLDFNYKKSNITSINGNLLSDKFNLDQFVNIKNLGDFSSDISLNIAVDSLSDILGGEGNIEGVISSIHFKEYNYKDIKLNAELKKESVFGFVGLNDDNLNFKLNGSCDFSREKPYYKFNLDLDKANLTAIGLNKRDSVSIISGRVLSDLNGNEIDELNGELIIDKLKYIGVRDTIIAKDKIVINAMNNAKTKSITVKSEYIDFSFSGVNSYDKLTDYFKNSIHSYIPTIASSKFIKNIYDPNVSDSLESGNIDDYYAIVAEIKNPGNISEIIIPSLSISDNTKFTFIFNPFSDSFSLTLTSEFIQYKGNLISNITVDSKNKDRSIDLFARAESVYLNDIYFPNFSVVANIENDKMSSSFGFSNKEDDTYALIKTQSEIYNNASGVFELRVDMLPSTLNLYNNTWKSDKGVVILNDEKVTISNLNLNSKDQSLNLDGVISNNISDTIALKLDNFSIAPVGIFVSDMGFNLEGSVGGYLYGYALKSKDKRQIMAHLNFANSSVNNIPIPNATFGTDWSDDKRVMHFNLISDDTKVIKGSFDVKSREYYADVKMDKFNIATMSPFLNTIAREVEGEADIDVSISNSNGYFEINGDVAIPHLSAVIDATNTRYNISTLAKIENNQYKLIDGKMSDGLGGTGEISGGMTNENYKKVKYNIEVQANEILCLNTTERENSIYYGRSFATGVIKITGDRNKILLDANARVAKRSTFFLPLGGKTLSAASFIKFASKDTVEVQRNLIARRKKEVTKAAFEMRMRLIATPLLESVIVMDQETGSSIKAVGDGVLDIHIEPSNEVFNIDGEYVIDKGTYSFILPFFKFFEKQFIIKNGSSIRWNGDPLDAILNVDAIYELKASLAPILGNDKGYDRRVDVDCILNIRDKLTMPKITLGVEVPDAQPEEQSALRSALSNQEAISTQLFWLLVANSFSATTGVTTTNSNAKMGVEFGTTTAIEFLTNQIKNIISSDKFDFGINYRPESENGLNSNEFEIDFSAPILNNKLYLEVTGNYNFLDGAQLTDEAKHLSGDVFLTWILNNSGNLSLKGFTRTIDTFDENQGKQESGIGVYYKASFENIQDLKVRYTEYLEKRKEERKKKQKKRKEKRKANKK